MNISNVDLLSVLIFEEATVISCSVPIQRLIGRVGKYGRKKLPRPLYEA